MGQSNTTAISNGTQYNKVKKSLVNLNVTWHQAADGSPAATWEDAMRWERFQQGFISSDLSILLAD